MFVSAPIKILRDGRYPTSSWSLMDQDVLYVMNAADKLLDVEYSAKLPGALSEKVSAIFPRIDWSQNKFVFAIKSQKLSEAELKELFEFLKTCVKDFEKYWFEYHFDTFKLVLCGDFKLNQHKHVQPVKYIECKDCKVHDVKCDDSDSEIDEGPPTFRTMFFG